MDIQTRWGMVNGKNERVEFIGGGVCAVNVLRDWRTTIEKNVRSEDILAEELHITSWHTSRVALE